MCGLCTPPNHTHKRKHTDEHAPSAGGPPAAAETAAALSSCSVMSTLMSFAATASPSGSYTKSRKFWMVKQISS